MCSTSTAVGTLQSAARAGPGGYCELRRTRAVREDCEGVEHASVQCLQCAAALAPLQKRTARGPAHKHSPSIAFVRTKPKRLNISTRRVSDTRGGPKDLPTAVARLTSPAAARTAQRLRRGTTDTHATTTNGGKLHSLVSPRPRAIRDCGGVNVVEPFSTPKPFPPRQNHHLAFSLSTTTFLARTHYGARTTARVHPPGAHVPLSFR